MQKTERPAAKRGKEPKREYHWRGEIVRMAAINAGCSESMVYKVMNGNATSAPVQRAIKLAKEQLRQPNNRRSAE